MPDTNSDALIRVFRSKGCSLHVSITGKTVKVVGRKKGETKKLKFVHEASDEIVLMLKLFLAETE